MRLAAVALASAFGDLGWDAARIVDHAVRLEGHPDNVAACWHGGLTIAALWAPEGAHYVGTREVQGYDALEQRVTGSHEKNVRDGGHRFKVSAVHALQDAVMVDWNMVPSAGDAVVAAGRDVFIVDADHRILIDYQFIVG